MSAPTIFLFVTGAGRAKDIPELIRETVAADWKRALFYLSMKFTMHQVVMLFVIIKIYHSIYSHSAQCWLRLAQGLAENLATSMIAEALGAKCPVFIAPAMKYGLWNHPQIRISETKLKEWGCTIIPPHIDGKNVTMASIADILEVLREHFKQSPWPALIDLQP